MTKAVAKVPQQSIVQMMNGLDEHIRVCANVEVSRTVAYLELCKFVRREQVPDDMVRDRMIEAGFHKVRVSEILKVCSAPADIFSAYAERTLGFRRVLALARFSADGKVADVTVAGRAVAQQMGGGSSNVIEVVEKFESDSKAASAFVEESKAKGTVSAKSRCDRAAAFIFKYSTKGRVWDSGDGWRLVLEKSGKGKSKPVAAKGGAQ